MASLTIHPIVEQNLHEFKSYYGHNSELPYSLFSQFSSSDNMDDLQECYLHTLREFYNDDCNIQFCGKCFGLGYVTEGNLFYGDNNDTVNRITCNMCCCEYCGDLQYCSCTNNEDELCESGDGGNDCQCYDLEKNRHHYLTRLEDRKRLVFPICNEMFVKQDFDAMAKLHNSMWLSSDKWFHHNTKGKFEASPYRITVQEELNSVLSWINSQK